MTRKTQSNAIPKPTPVQLDDDDLNRVQGGATYAPIVFTKRVDKITP